jgi:hypothetical protein
MSYEYNQVKYKNMNDNDNDSNQVNGINENNDNDNIIEMSHIDPWRLQNLYTDTKYIYAVKPDEVITCDQLFARQNRIPTHPSSIPVIVKDMSRPYTYHTMKSYGQAQDNNYYVNFDDHVSGSGATSGIHDNNNNYNHHNKTFENEYPSFHNSGCAKTYLCSLLVCFTCCLFQLKPV